MHCPEFSDASTAFGGATMVQKTFPAEDSALNDWLAFAQEALERAMEEMGL